jgi:hypothetical protein
MATYPGKRTPDQRTFATLTITTAADGLSDVLDCGGLTACNIGMSTAWTEGPISFLGSIGSSTSMQSLYDLASSGTGAPVEISFTSTAGRIVVLDPHHFWGVRFLQLRSGSSSTGIAVQQAARSVRVGLAAFQPFK